MTEHRDNLDTYLDAAAEQQSLCIAPAHRAGVLQFLRVARDMADVVQAVGLDEMGLALAPVYVPPGRIVHGIDE